MWVVCPIVYTKGIPVIVWPLKVHGSNNSWYLKEPGDINNKPQTTILTNRC